MSLKSVIPKREEYVRSLKGLSTTPCDIIGLVLIVVAMVTKNPLVTIFLFLLYPSVILIPLTVRNFLITLPLVIGLNVSLLTTVVILVNAFFKLSISLSSVTNILLLLMTACLVAKYLFGVKIYDFFANLRKIDYVAISIIYIFFVLALYSRVASVFDAPVPLVSDPEAHAFWARRIVSERSINYFYSPGLHLWSAFSSQLSGLDVAKSVNIITNLLSAAGVLYWGLTSYVVSKKRLFSVVVAFFLLVSPIPTNLYYIAGKNSLITALTLFSGLIIATAWYAEKPQLKRASILLLSLLSVGLVHYPVYIFAICFSSLFILIYSPKNAGNKTFLLRSVYYLRSIVPIFISLLLIGATAYITKTREVPIISFQDHASARVFHESFSTHQPSYVSEYSAPTTKKDAVDLRNPLKQLSGYPKEILALTNKVGGHTGLVIIGIVLVAIIYIITASGFVKPRYDTERRAKQLAIALLLCIPLVVLPLKIFSFSSFEIIPDAGSFLIFTFASFSVGLLFSGIVQKYRTLFCLGLMLVAIISSLSVYRLYSTRQEKSVVNMYDEMAFEWIDKNVVDGVGFIGTAKLNPTRNQVVYPVDGSLWLPVITGNPIATPFQEGSFTAIQSHINYEYLDDLSNPDLQKNSLVYFYKNNYKYIYIDGIKPYEIFNVDSLLKSNLVRIVYRNDDIQIAEILK